MPERIHFHRERSPRTRVRTDDNGDTDGYFFPGEVARLLHLDNIDYEQLRNMFELIRLEAGRPKPPVNKWARYTLADIARLDVVVELAGGRGALATKRRLNFTGIVETCASLRTRGYEDPLLHVPMLRQGRKIFALINGAVLDPRTGQLLLADAHERVEAFLAERSIRTKDLRGALKKERSQAAKGHAIPRGGQLPMEAAQLELDWSQPHV